MRACIPRTVERERTASEAAASPSASRARRRRRRRAERFSGVCVENKCARPFRQAEFDVKFSSGRAPERWFTSCRRESTCEG